MFRCGYGFGRDRGFFGRKLCQLLGRRYTGYSEPRAHVAPRETPLSGGNYEYIGTCRCGTGFHVYYKDTKTGRISPCF
ncbi:MULTISPECIES: hypothetical protein [Methanothermococcus]|jgi:hypothetical protein|uniref:hypothetical protein n=1 Tax=Methanothermococcus TaxID=155862 RepID=UPI0012F6DAC2|nr:MULTISPECIES: hypothetical protein [Methanothermococcus]